MDLVSVIIPAYNSEKWLETTLSSVLEQSYPEYEIIVVDDGSRDKTAEIAEHALNNFPGSWKVLRQQNQRVSAARNTGWRAARGSWVHFLDSDDVIVPDTIKLLMTVAEKSSPEIAVVYSSWQRVIGEGDQLLPVEETQTPQLDEKPPPASLLIRKNNIQTGSFLVRRPWLDATQGFDENWGRCTEDTEFLLRIAMAGGGFRCVPSSKPLLLWRMYPDQPRWGDDSARYRVTDVTNAWRTLVDRTASNGQIENCGLSSKDSEALIAECTMYLRVLYRHDRSAFQDFLAWLRRLVPGYLPRRPLSLWLTAKCLGYERAEAIAEILRPIKQRLRKK
jgi:glycosyltransferase involved in cell wall biosynthesis